MELIVDDESAVSPVIGTILLVAITVVLVAVITAVVMGVAGSVSSTKDVGVSVTPVGIMGERAHYYITEPLFFSGVNVLIYGGKDVEKLTTIHVAVEGAHGTVFVPNLRVLTDPNVEEIQNLARFKDAYSAADATFDPVGTPFTFLPILPMVSQKSDFLGNGDYVNPRVIVIGYFSDGTSSIIYDGKMSLLQPPEGRVVPNFGVIASTPLSTAQYDKEFEDPTLSYQFGPIFA